jgi:hypothetical protein
MPRGLLRLLNLVVYASLPCRIAPSSFMLKGYSKPINAEDHPSITNPHSMVKTNDNLQVSWSDGRELSRLPSSATFPSLAQPPPQA